jgi:putative hemolysin
MRHKLLSMEEFFVIVICLTLNALFAAYEMAFVAIPRAELRSIARKGNLKAQKLLKLREQPERTLSIIQVGITLVGAIAAAVGGLGASEKLEPYFMQTFDLREIHATALSVVLVVLPITYLNVVVGELVPKTLALRNPLKIVLAGARILFISDRLLAPVISHLEWSTKTILRLLFQRSKKNSNTQDASTIEIDSLSPTHQKYMWNMAQLETKKIRDALIPWEQTNSVKKTDSLNDVLQVVLQSGHTRLPVIEAQKVIGILHTKEFIAFKESGEVEWLRIVRPAFYTQTTDSVLKIMRSMQEKKIHMAIVGTEATTPIGIVTLEDLIEEIVGDIYDEDDDGTIRQVFASKARLRHLANK